MSRSATSRATSRSSPTGWPTPSSPGIDRVLWLGHDPAVVLHHTLGTVWANWLMAGVYLAVDRTGAGQPGDRAGVDAPVARRCVVRHGDLLDWLPGRGPLLRRAVPRTRLLLARVVRLAAAHAQHLGAATCCSPTASRCWRSPGTPARCRPIAAFASLHVAIMVTICLVAELIRLPVAMRLSSWAFARAHLPGDGLPGVALLRRRPRRLRSSARCPSCSPPGHRPPAPPPR